MFTREADMLKRSSASCGSFDWRRLMIDSLALTGQLMACSVLSLKNPLAQYSEQQSQHIEKLGLNISQLCIALAHLPGNGERIERNLMHDLRNQLSIVSMRAQLLRVRNTGELGKEAVENLEKIVAGCEHVSTVLGLASKNS
jgi:hypothetical protein